MLSSEPSETYRVHQMTPTNTGSAMSTMAGDTASMPPVPAATPRPPLKWRKIERQAPSRAARPASARDQVGSSRPTRQQDGYRALGDVKDADQDGPFGTHGSQRVGATGASRADRAWVAATGQTGYQHAHRQRADEVAEHDQHGGLKQSGIHRQASIACTIRPVMTTPERPRRDA